MGNQTCICGGPGHAEGSLNSLLVVKRIRCCTGWNAPRKGYLSRWLLSAWKAPRHNHVTYIISQFPHATMRRVHLGSSHPITHLPINTRPRVDGSSDCGVHRAPLGKVYRPRNTEAERLLDGPDFESLLLRSLHGRMPSLCQLPPLAC